MGHPLITIIGPISSGKSTASRLIAQHFKIPLVDADLFETNPFLPLYVLDTRRWSFTTELFFTIQRIKKLKRLARLVKKQPVVVDAGLIMSHEVYTKNHLVQGTMTAAEYEFLTQIIEDYQTAIPQPTLIVNLTASPEIQWQRINSRGRSFETDYTMAYLRQITDRLEEFAVKIRHQPDLTMISFSTETDDLANESGRQKLIETIKPYLE